MNEKESDLAEKLRTKNVEVFKGDLSDENSLRSALQGMKTVFGATYSRLSKEGEEFHQGQLLAHCAKAEGVSHFVFRYCEQTRSCNKFYR
jgi:uncharacterized protein YbjT (DUF2867 family)